MVQRLTLVTHLALAQPMWPAHLPHHTSLMRFLAQLTDTLALELSIVQELLLDTMLAQVMVVSSPVQQQRSKQVQLSAIARMHQRVIILDLVRVLVL